MLRDDALSPGVAFHIHRRPVLTLVASEPLDFDRHCGVINDKGLPCSRSLTCKTHTVGAKRAVLGRSRPFDELHLEWQRKHNPNFKEPARRDVNGTNGPGSSTKNAKRKDSKLGKKGPGGGGPGPGEDDGHGGGPEGESQRELEELIHFTRVAGDRVRDAIGWGWSFGVGLGGGIAAGLGLMTSGATSASRAGSSGGVGGGTTAGAGAGAGAGGGAGSSTSAANSRATSAGPSKSNARNGTVNENGNANASGLGTGNGNTNGSGNPFGRPDKPRPTSCNAVWRSHTDFAGVGEMFQKALAARPPKQPQHPHHAQHQHQHQHPGHSHAGKNANANAQAAGAAAGAAGQHGGTAPRILPAMAAGGVPPEQAVQPGMFGVTA